MAQTAGLTIEYWPLDRLAPNARNARTHSDAQVAQIAASIKAFGFTNPLLADPEDGELIAGHGRLGAAQGLGLAEVPVIPLRGLSSAQKRALRLADNKLALNAGWNDQLLKIELADLGQAGFDLSLVGFSPVELGELLGNQTPRADPDPPAEFQNYDENLVTDYRCPSCSYEWSGKPR